MIERWLMYMTSVVDTIKASEPDSKWLWYGFTRLTGIRETSIDIIVTHLRVFWGMSDNDIIKLCNATYGPHNIYM